MRVLHLSTSDTRGGAARGSYFLHRSLRELGVDSRMLVGRKYADDDTVTELSGSGSRVVERVRGYLDALPLRAYAKTCESYWTVGWFPRRIRDAIAAQKPDIVHVHWTGGGFLPVAALRDIPAPVVWTMRDMWAMTGGCHYSATCERHAQGCGACPQLSSDRENDLSRRNWMNKRANWHDLDISLVAISRWLADCVDASGIFGRARIDVIPNGIDVGTFRPVDRTSARADLRLPEDRTVILFGAIGALTDERKGFGKLIEALTHLRREPDGAKYLLAVFGNDDDDRFPDVGVETRRFGRISDDDFLAKLYAAADIMVTPSFQEAFGKTLIEAMGCGTPVVAFDAGGPSDIVVHRETGYLARPFDAEDLGRGIAWCTESRLRSEVLGRAANKRTREEYSSERVGLRYRQHYQEELARSA